MERIRINEEWRPVVGWEGFYEVSNLGFFRSCDRWITQKNGVARLHHGQPIEVFYPTTSVYPKVSLWRDNKMHLVPVHVALAEAFKAPKPEWATCVRHLNDDKRDFRLCNVDWGTDAINSEDKFVNGGGVWGERNYNAKLNTKDVVAIRAKRQAGMSWNKLAAEYPNVSLWTIRSAVTKSWKRL